MDTRIDPEELRASARRLLEKHADRRAPYAVGAHAGASALRSAMVEAGWMLLTLPAEVDGLEQSFVALAAIHQELGRALSPISLAATMAAADVLTLAPGPAARGLLSAIGGGEIVFAAAVARGLDLRNEAIDGQLRDVADGSGSTHLLLTPDGGDGPVLVVDLSERGVERHAVSMWDRTRAFADITFEGVRACLVVSGPDAERAASVAHAHLDLAVACDSIGGGEAALELTIAYMGVRRQFDRPIGSFQALKHRAADLKVGLEIARALTNQACEAFAARKGDWSGKAAQAKVLAADAYAAIAEEAVQMHGGIGFTWEHDCHLFLKRALLDQMLGGTPEQYLDAIAPALFRRALTRDNPVA